MKTLHSYGLKFCSLVILVCMALQIAACGTLLYPERRGQKMGHIDAGIAVLDGIGLLIGIIPGVIAFAVDFSTGAIYLPGGSRTELQQSNKMTVIYANPADLHDDLFLKNIIQSAMPQVNDADYRAVQFSTINRGTDLTKKVAML